MAYEQGVTYKDVEAHVAYIKARWGRSVTYRLDPDYMKHSDQVSVRYWVVAECWGNASKGEPVLRKGAWFRGGSGFRTMPEAMYTAVSEVLAALNEAEAVASGQASF